MLTVIEREIMMLTTEAGAGRPIIFVPGWLASSAWWCHQVGRFATGYRAVAVDYGWGNSRTVDDCVDGLERILDAESQPAVLIGWSLGAAIAMRLVERFGTSGIAGLVLVDQTPRSQSGPDWPHGVKGLGPEMLVRAPAAARAALPMLAEQVVPASFAQPLDEKMRARLIDEALRWSPEVAAGLIEDHWSRDYRPSLARIDVPTLLVAGGRSAFTPIEAMRYLHEVVPGSRLQVMGECGHAPFIEAPVAFNRALERFLTIDVHVP